MIPALVIQRKRDGVELDTAEIAEFIAGLGDGSVTDYQASAFLMATFFRGMTARETMALTRAMLESGDRLDLSDLPGVKVDKHSTGGVGDKVSLVLAPLAAACGVSVPMMSGRGLGHSGGTLDKLESIPGFRVNLTTREFRDILARVGCAMIGQTDRVAPADKRLYALRDVTATVECIPLIVASILSKKLAEGTDSLVLDVKFGSGAFMKSRPQAKRLATALVQTAKKLGLPCRALLTDMSQPLGYSVGNSLEVWESLEVLKGEHLASPWGSDAGSADLRELTLQLCAQMLHLSGRSRNLAEARRLALQRLTDGSAYRKFLELVEAQGGKPGELDQAVPRLPIAPGSLVATTDKRGFLAGCDAEKVGQLLVALGGGRKTATDRVDPSVGMVFHRKLGAAVKPGDAVATLFYDPARTSESQASRVRDDLLDAFRVSRTRPALPKLVSETLG